ncbi:hypothetical protein [uncultured Mitsuokella sp.]|uniref:hypothetical protein n=1 Tax=uncultured Mitsuokella sp. TaxID=453120 RepID=UPI0026299580|nr:hypothetical protein [uncultured Mitsuokella sp.]
MSEETTKPNQPDVRHEPHGREQQIKMEMLDMIHRAESPYDIIYHVAKWLEAASGEPGYATYVEDQIRGVYGFALAHKRPLEDELKTVEARLSRIEASYENPVFTEEEHTRIGFAIDRHKKNIERLKRLIERAEADGTPAVIEKN